MLMTVLQGPEMGCGVGYCISLYSPDGEEQPLCCWCEIWLDVSCLGDELGEDEVASSLHHTKMSLSDGDGDSHLLALAPISQGCGDVVGPIRTIMDAFGSDSCLSSSETKEDIGEEGSIICT